MRRCLILFIKGSYLIQHKWFVRTRKKKKKKKRFSETVYGIFYFSYHKVNKQSKNYSITKGFYFVFMHIRLEEMILDSRDFRVYIIHENPPQTPPPPKKHPMTVETFNH